MCKYKIPKELNCCFFCLTSFTCHYLYFPPESATPLNLTVKKKREVDLFDLDQRIPFQKRADEGYQCSLPFS